MIESCIQLSQRHIVNESRKISNEHAGYTTNLHIVRITTFGDSTEYPTTAASRQINLLRKEDHVDKALRHYLDLL